jgi:hypothetical protein
MDKFLDAFNQSKFNQEDINHLNTSISSIEIEAVIISQRRTLVDLADL